MAGEHDVASSVASDLTNVVKDFSVDKASTDAAQDQKETAWTNDHWTQDLAYYNEIPEVMGVIDAKVAWTSEGGFTADPQTTLLLDTIRGNGFDTFTSILGTLDRTKEIGGDCYGHIIRDSEGNLINLKPLPVESMQHVVGRDGMFIRFEQINRTTGKTIRKYKLEEMFYVPRNRVNDEIHGNTMITRLAFIILARNEAMADYKQVMHRFVKPRWKIALDTDKPAKIAVEKAKWDKANADGENMYTPMGAVEADLIAVSPNATLNPLTWIESLNTYFYESAQVPRIVVGGSGGFTDAAVKIALVGYTENIKKRQLFWEDQIRAQLNLVIKLKEPVNLMNDLLSQQGKQGDQQAVEPNDVTAELEGNT